MTTWYVDPTDGVDLRTAAQAQDSATPWKHLETALAQCSAGDTIIVNAPDFDNCVRGGQVITKAINLRSATAEPIHIMGSFDITEGNLYHRVEQFDTFYGGDSNAATSWNYYQGSSAEETGGGNELYVSCTDMDSTGGTASIRKGFAWAAGQSYRPHKIRFAYKTDGTAELVVAIEDDDGSNEWDITQGIWVSGSGAANVYTGTSWTEVDSGIITEPASGFGSSSYIKFRNLTASGAGHVYLQYIIVEYQCVWEDYDSNVKLFRFEPPKGGTDWEMGFGSRGDHPQVPYLFKCTNAEWTASNVDALMLVPTEDASGDIAALSAGYAYFDTANDILYYRPSSGETHSDMHFELCYGNQALKITAAASVSNLRIATGQVGIQTDAASGTAVVDNATISTNSILAAKNSGGLSKYTNCHSIDTAAQHAAAVADGGAKFFGGGFTATHGTMELYGCSVNYCGDDGYQPINESIMRMYGCAAANCIGYSIEPIQDNVSGELTVKGFTGSQWIGALQTADITMTLVDVAVPQITWGGSGGRTNVSITNMLCTATGLTGANLPASAITDNITFNSTLDYVDSDNGDLTPATTSDAFGSGSRWWTGANPTSAYGEPYSDIDTDLGGVQSTLGPFHPKNL